jgi:hypothetical protein
LRGWRLLAFYNVYGTIHANWVSKWLLFNVKLAFSIIIARTSYIFHYHGENKLHFPLSWREQVTFSSIMARTSYIFQYHGENKLHFSVSWREQVTFYSIMARTSYIFQYHGENKLHFPVSWREQVTFSIIMARTSYILMRWWWWWRIWTRPAKQTQTHDLSHSIRAR